MSRTRWLIAIGLGAALAALFGWQTVRERQIARCIEQGGVWQGPQSRCAPDPARSIIQRDLYRS